MLLLIICIVVPAVILYILRRKSEKKIELDGKTIVITGASSGIGKGLAYFLKNYKVNLYLCARSSNILEDIKNDLVAINDHDNTHNINSVHCIPLDLKDETSIENAYTAISSTTKKVDILINCAGISSRQNSIDTSMSVFRELMEINFFGTISFTLKFLKHNLINKNMGTIVTIGSIQSIIGIKNRSAYAASKFATCGFFDCLRAEIKQSYGNVRVISILPSHVATNISINALTSTGDKHNIMDENTIKGMSTDYVAKKTWACITNSNSTQELILTPSFKIKLAIFLRHIFPNFIFKKIEQL